MTKKEKKLLKAARKIEKISSKYMKELTKIDDVIQELPVSLTRKYDLEGIYFSNVPSVAIAMVQLELFRSRLEKMLPKEIRAPHVGLTVTD